MVEDYLSENEQAEALKEWWRDNWAWVVAGVAIGLSLLSGWQYYLRYQTQHAEAADTLLDQFATAIKNDKAKADSLLQELTDKYSTTPYADQAHLLKAQDAVEASDFPTAVTQLRIVMSDSKDKQLRLVAKLRLARVLIQQHKEDEALSLLDAANAGSFLAQAHEIRGDALYAKNDVNGARAEYQSALDAYKDEPQADVSLLQLKLTDLSDANAHTSKDASSKASTS